MKDSVCYKSCPPVGIVAAGTVAVVVAYRTLHPCCIPAAVPSWPETTQQNTIQQNQNNA